MAVIDGTTYPEVVARSYQVRGDLHLALRDKAAAVHDFIVAEEMFSDMGQRHAAAVCWWSAVRIDSVRVAGVRLTDADIATLEELADNPAERRRAVEEHERRARMPAYRRLRLDWTTLLYQEPL
jgi:hypothetical protein